MTAARRGTGDATQPGLSVVLVQVSAGEIGPDYHAIRRVRLIDVAATDDVAVLRGTGAGAYVAKLAALLGPAMPRVMVIAPRVDLPDARLALINGATSYVIESPRMFLRGQGLADVFAMTAAGMGCLDPPIATELTRWMRKLQRQPASKASGRPPVPASRAEVLSPREAQIMSMLASGHTIAEVAVKLGLSGGTVRNNLTRIYAKLKVRRQTEAILAFLEEDS